MKIIVYNGKKIRLFDAHFLPRWLNVGAITLGYNILFAKFPSDAMMDHELVHISQILKHGILKFYWLYLREYIGYRIVGLSHSDAYMAISFEKEAYNH